VSAVTEMLSLDSELIKERLFAAIGTSRQSYAQAQARQMRTRNEEAEILDNVRQWRRRHPMMGSRPLFHSMRESGIELGIGVTKFERLLSRAGMTVGQARRSGPHTSDGKGKRSYPNLTNGLIINDINQLVVADITYFWLKDRWHYIFTLKDVYSQRVISLLPSDNIEAINAVETLNELCELRGEQNLTGCKHHTDNGSQYEAEVFRTRLASLKMVISRAEECKQNGSSEQLNHIVKNMYLKHMGINSKAALEIGCRKVKKLMNKERTVHQLGNLTVEQFEARIKGLPPDRRPLKQLYDFTKHT